MLHADFLLPAFMLPSLRTLYFDHMMSYDYAENLNLIRHPQSSHMGMSAILHLDFEMCALLQDALRILLRIPRALGSFTWRWERAFNSFTGEGDEGLFIALELQAKSLTKIYFRGCRRFHRHWRAVGFPSLEYIGIPISLLLFARVKGSQCHESILNCGVSSHDMPLYLS
jgi:hypothetical protein